MGEEPRFKWQDGLGLAGAPLAIGGMADMPLPLRLACFLACAVCSSICFSSQKSWPLWGKWLLTLFVVLLMCCMSWYAWKKSYEITAQAQISVTRITGEFGFNTQTGKEGFFLNIYYRNSGTGPIAGPVKHRTRLLTSPSALSDEDVMAIQGQARQIAYSSTDAKLHLEIEPNSPELFFTPAQGYSQYIAEAADAHEVVEGKKRLYAIVAFKYRDASLEHDKARLTEICRWAEGNFGAWHFCGMNQTTLIDLTQQ